MKGFLVLTICFLISTVSGQTFIPGRKVSRGGRSVKTAADLCTGTSTRFKTYCNGNGNQCDATGLILCTGTNKGIQFDCGGNLPYCREAINGMAKCEKIKPEGCDSIESEYECMAEGFFPDASNCHKYYQCTTENEEGFFIDEYECNDLYVFDPSAPNGDYCRFTRNRFCVTAKCENTIKNILMSYPFFPRNRGEIVATCRGGRKPFVTRCEAGFQADLQTLPVECKIVCRRASKFEYPGDESKYYECVRTLRGWEGKIKSCYRGYYFNKVTKQCTVSPTTTSTTEASTISTVSTEPTSETTAETTISTTEASTASTEPTSETTAETTISTTEASTASTGSTSVTTAETTISTTEASTASTGSTSVTTAETTISTTEASTASTGSTSITTAETTISTTEASTISTVSTEP